MGTTYFTPRLFEFLVELDANNNRDWFQANKARYQRDVQEPMLAFIADVDQPLRRISPRFVADPRPVGGSMFRIYRDVRFAKDKTPYKTVASAHFRHARHRDVHGPGFYLHLEPGNVFVGAGLWRPDAPTLARIRAAVIDRSSAWIAARDDAGFRATHELRGDSLVRPPRGVDPDHPLIEDLKRKDFVSVQNLDDEQVFRADFLTTVIASFQAAAPLMRFLTTAVGLDFD